MPFKEEYLNTIELSLDSLKFSVFITIVFWLVSAKNGNNKSDNYSPNRNPNFNQELHNDGCLF